MEVSYRVVVKRQIVLTIELNLPAFDHEDAIEVARLQSETGELGRIESWLEELPYDWKVVEEKDSVVSVQEIIWPNENE